jgi:hypothetical protein
MKYIKSLLEKEFSDNWFDENPKNYLVKNIKDLEKQKKDKKSYLYYVGRNKDLDLKLIVDKIDYKDIILKKEESFTANRYRCTHPLIYDGDLPFITLDIYPSKDLEKDDSFNRIHTMMGIKQDLTGLGLGYKAYKRVIKEVGFVRSSVWRTNINSRKIWTNLIKDSDFYVMTYKKKEDDKYTKKVEGTMVFHKEMNPNEIKNIIDEFSKNTKLVTILDYCEPLKKLLKK